VAFFITGVSLSIGCHSKPKSGSNSSRETKGQNGENPARGTPAGSAENETGSTNQQEGSPTQSPNGQFTDNAWAYTCDVEVLSSQGSAEAKSFALKFSTQCEQKGDRQFHFSCRQNSCTSTEGLKLDILDNDSFSISVPQREGQDPISADYYRKGSTPKFQQRAPRGGRTLLSSFDLLKSAKTSTDKLDCNVTIPATNQSIPLLADPNPFILTGPGVTARFVVTENESGQPVLESYSQTDFDTLYTGATIIALKKAGRWYSEYIPGTGLLAQYLAKSNLEQISKLFHVATVNLDGYGTVDKKTRVKLRVRDLTESTLDFGSDSTAYADDLKPFKQDVTYMLRNGGSKTVSIELGCAPIRF
jgi:hypothetical protein